MYVIAFLFFESSANDCTNACLLSKAVPMTALTLVFYRKQCFLLFFLSVFCLFQLSFLSIFQTLHET